MTVSDVHAQLRSGQVQKFYIFTGVEWRVQRMYIEQISKMSSKEVRYIDSMNDIYKSLRTSLISKSCVYVVRDDHDILTNEKLQAQLKQQTVLGDNILILLLTSVDKRKKFYTQFKDSIVEFEPLKPQVLKKYLMREINLNDRNFEILMEVCEYDYGRCLLEIDKMKRTGSNAYDQIFRKFLNDGTIYVPPRDAVFKFVESVLKRKSDMFELLQESYESGEATLVLLTVLYNNAKQVLQVQSSSGNDKEIAKSTGLTPWQIKYARDKAGHYTNGELVRLMRLCQKVEKFIKIGQIDESIAVEYVILNVV